MGRNAPQLQPDTAVSYTGLCPGICAFLYRNGAVEQIAGELADQRAASHITATASKVFMVDGKIPTKMEIPESEENDSKYRDLLTPNVNTNACKSQNSRSIKIS